MDDFLVVPHGFTYLELQTHASQPLPRPLPGNLERELTIFVIGNMSEEDLAIFNGFSTGGTNPSFMNRSPCLIEKQGKHISKWVKYIYIYTYYIYILDIGMVPYTSHLFCRFPSFSVIGDWFTHQHVAGDFFDPRTWRLKLHFWHLRTTIVDEHPF